ncbi:TetR/AcrR family transcriptional regulator [Bordetella sp. 02P26C-1]|uniref:TetR/AcrR family transcriptional regulator n=1 Tax=Bordetella sp. 02P26C-1 TaxID=2683195 RepID=UPI0013535A53|nr:TetR/AcrR family transcriptional regulator [Bordetella sp. 02P26C-1]MVW78268.1 TetR family transcriptional regulator [Bordetella sp. 02P26C-1]
MDTENTRTHIVRLAQRLIQERGYNGFSYRDLAASVGIKTASIHYYFPQKEDLLLAVISDYQTRWHEAIQNIPSGLRADEKLRAYVEVHRRACAGNQLICIGGILAAELGSLPGCARKALQSFYACNEQWLVELLEQGAREGSLRVPGDVRVSARAIYAALQGGLVSARLFDHQERATDLLPCLLA